MSSSHPVRVGTRGSTLAVTQTGWVVAQLRGLGAEVEVETIRTRGDAGGDRPIASLGRDGVFVRELEQALLDRRIDVAVHSLKDLPTAETPGLAIACVPVRGLPFDVLVTRSGGTLRTLPPGAVVGTSSIRRVMQVRAVRDDLVIRPLRGNVDSRLRKLDAGEYDGLILAGAGLERLGFAHRITEVLRPDEHGFWPAVSQGALAVQIRADDAEAGSLVGRIDDPPTHAAVRAERACLAALAGGCLAPVGGWARFDPAGALVLGATVLDDESGSVRRIVAEGVATGDPAAVSGDGRPEMLGREVAAALESQGADAMLARMRAGGHPPS